MRLHIINPNSSAAMTAQITRVARSCALPGTILDIGNPATTPISIEGHADEALSVPAMLAAIARADADGADAHVVACFDDPGIGAAREVSPNPVIGLCEASVRVALTLSKRFSVVTTLPRSVPLIEDLVEHYGASRQCRDVRAINLPVLEIECNAGEALGRLATEIRACRENGAEAVVLGCAGMADLCARLTEQTGVLVIDGVVSAVKLAEALAGTGYRTSKSGAYAAPYRKAGGFAREVA